MHIEMFPAKNGDAFLIRLDNRKNILIDMGYSDTYENYIRDRLIQIKEEGECIDLLVITHIDEDHIEGAIEFFKENGMANNPTIIEVKEVWHNSYRHLQFDIDKVNSISDTEKELLDNIILSNSSLKKNKICESKPVSAKQGSTLAGLLYGLGYYDNRWNLKFNKSAVNCDMKFTVQIDRDITIHLLSPNTKKLNTLSKYWLKKLKKIFGDFNISNDKIFDDAYEMYIKNLNDNSDINEQFNISYKHTSFKNIIESHINQKVNDSSKSNGASISFILEYNMDLDKKIKLLFLGDAHEDIVIENLQRYKEQSDDKLEFDVVKLAHHGSIKNNFKWIEEINSKKYLFSSNGKNGHPSREVIAKILQYDKNKKSLYFNYPVEISNIINDSELMKNYNFNLICGDGNSIIRIEEGESND